MSSANWRDARLPPVSQECDAGLNLWVASPPIVWPWIAAQGLEDSTKWEEHGNAQMQRAVDAAVAAGFPLESTPTGRGLRSSIAAAGDRHQTTGACRP